MTRLWTQQILHDGFLLLPPGGAAIGEIRVEEAVRPLVCARAALVDVLERLRGIAEVDGVPAGERLTTDEGELAGLAFAPARVGGAAGELAVGLIVADDFYRRVTGMCRAPAACARFRAAVRELVVRGELGLGELRHRRFAYTPPPGWQGLARGLTTEWFPLDFPRRHVVITALAARPHGGDSARARLSAILAASSFGFAAGAATWEDLETARGLHGARAVLAGRGHGGAPRYLELAVLVDDRFCYPLRLECDLDELGAARAWFADVIDSVDPLPRPRCDGAAAVSPWCDGAPASAAAAVSELWLS